MIWNYKKICEFTKIYEIALRMACPTRKTYHTSHGAKSGNIERKEIVKNMIIKLIEA
jgi:hypothetical protein